MEAKYLGMIIDAGLTFLLHAKYLRDKLKQMAGRFRRVAVGEWWLNTRIMRSIYKGLAVHILAYCSSALSHRASNSHVLGALVAGQRPFLLSVTRACRTVSNDALQVLTGCLAPDLEILRSTVRYCLRRGQPVDFSEVRFCGGQRSESENRTALGEVDRVLITQWQERWELYYMRCANTSIEIDLKKLNEEKEKQIFH